MAPEHKVARGDSRRAWGCQASRPSPRVCASGITAFGPVSGAPSPRPRARPAARDLEGPRVLERAPAFHDASAIMQAVVLAGRLATRMRPHTLTLHKWILPVAGRPFVDCQIELFVAAGLRDVVMCVAHLGEQIRAHV